MANRRLVDNFVQWRTTMAEGFDAVHNALETGNFVEACRIMDALTMEAAQASVAMRGIVVRAGKGEDLDE